MNLISALLIAFSASASAQNIGVQELGDTLTAFSLRYAEVKPIKVERQWVRNNVLYIDADENLACLPIRPHTVEQLKQFVLDIHKHKKYADVVLLSQGKPLETFITNQYLPVEKRVNLYRVPTENKALVRNLSQSYEVSKGLNQRHIALWASHGAYFEQGLNRWEWQRARLQLTVEDLFTSSFTMPFLVPMLENAGAIVLQPRERDTQLNEIIVDEDGSSGGEVNVKKNSRCWELSETGGFKYEEKNYIEGENPFTQGTYRLALSEPDEKEASCTEWTPNISHSGRYAVYVSYKSFAESTEAARYTVFHAGGETHFEVNQRMGGGAWVYVGTFQFDADNPDSNKVVLTNFSDTRGEIITADAVKFGGGMGNIARRPALGYVACNGDSLDYDYQTSELPRYLEAARYWMQWAGAPDSVYNFSEGSSDYIDDLSCRGRWVNYMSGGSAVNPLQQGLGIPIDLCFSFHTDAGVKLQDSIVGTLAIFTSWNQEKQRTFPNGVSRMNVRDLTDMVQTQIMDDLQAIVAPEWQRRSLYDRSFAESRHPNVPTMLLELLSHQNFADMRYGHDPRFKFIASRAIYKGILKYMHLQYATDYVVQPLPVNSFAVSRTAVQTLSLDWKPTVDSLESTAAATHYVVYTRVDDKGYDNGVRCDTTHFSIEVERGKHYSFKVLAANAGGVSMPSEALSAYIAPVQKGTALIVNAFDRVSAPASFMIDSTYAGFQPHDNGVPYMHDVSYVGDMYEFDRNVPWLDDDAPGYGASYATYQNMKIAGNTFDYPLVHGRAIAQAGYSYVSCSHSSIDTLACVDSTYAFVDVILGKQKQTSIGTEKKTVLYKTFSPSLQHVLRRYADAGVDILLSGAYIGSDLWNKKYSVKSDRDFVEQVLRYTYCTHNASQSGQVNLVQNSYLTSSERTSYSYFTQPNSQKYQIYDPDGIEPKGALARCVFRYSDTNISAGVASDGLYKTCVLAFPIEGLKSQHEIDKLLAEIIRFFER